MAASQPLDLLGERRLCAVRGRTAEPAHSQADHYPPCPPRRYRAAAARNGCGPAATLPRTPGTQPTTTSSGPLPEPSGQPGTPLLPAHLPGTAAARWQHQDRTAHMITEAASAPCATRRTSSRKLCQSLNFHPSPTRRSPVGARTRSAATRPLRSAIQTGVLIGDETAFEGVAPARLKRSDSTWVPPPAQPSPTTPSSKARPINIRPRSLCSTPHQATNTTPLTGHDGATSARNARRCQLRRGPRGVWAALSPPSAPAADGEESRSGRMPDLVSQQKPNSRLT